MHELRRLYVINVGGALLHKAREQGESPFPHQAAFLIDNPIRRALLKPARIVDKLGLTAAEHVLELGPGPGFFSVDIAVPAHRRPAGIVRHPTGDARQGPAPTRAGRAVQCRLHRGTGKRRLPFPDNTFDVAFLAAVIGEVPDKQACLRSLGHVLKPGGRLVFVEMFPIPTGSACGSCVTSSNRSTSSSSRRAGADGKPSFTSAASTASDRHVRSWVSPRAINGPTVSPTRSDASTSSAPPDIRLRKSMPAAMIASLK